MQTVKSALFVRSPLVAGATDLAEAKGGIHEVRPLQSLGMFLFQVALMTLSGMFLFMLWLPFF